MAKPTKFPRWATNDIVDPTSSKNNVVEPGESKKDLGFGPAGEFPLRQHFNWLFRIINDWFVWIDEEQNYRTGTFDIKIAGSDPEAIATVRWERLGHIVTLQFPKFDFILSGVSVLEINPVAADFPDEVMPPTGLGNTISMGILATKNGDGERMCRLQIKKWVDEWLIGWHTDNGDYDQSGWVDGATQIERQSVTYGVFEIESIQ